MRSAREAVTGSPPTWWAPLTYALALGLLTSCGTTEEDPTGGCGSLPCPAGYEADFTLTTPGTYAITVAFDSAMVTETCKVSATATCTCDATDIRVSATCTSSTITMYVENSAKSLDLTIDRDGTQILQSLARMPVYAPTYPNGDSCSPICATAAEMIPLP